MKNLNLYIILFILFGAIACSEEDAMSDMLPPDFEEPSSPSRPTNEYNYVVPQIDENNRIVVAGTPPQYTDTATMHVVSVPYDIISQKPMDINGYYEYAVGKKGEALKEALSLIISTGMEKLEYTPGVWALVREADENPLNNGEVWLGYTEMSLSKSFQDGSSSNSVVFNREHTWAKSHGLGDVDSPGPATDGHNIRAEERTVNTYRLNRDFATTNELKGWGHVGADGFCPRLSSRGDVARIMMYMAVRYGTELGIELDYEVNKDSAPRAGNLDDLIDWHSVDPVDPYEIRRNNVVFKYQRNRNPFVDHPELVDYVFGDKQEEAWDGGVVFSVN